MQIAVIKYLMSYVSNELLLINSKVFLLNCVLINTSVNIKIYFTECCVIHRKQEYHN